MSDREICSHGSRPACVQPLEPRALLSLSLVGDLQRDVFNPPGDSYPAGFVEYKGATYFLASATSRGANGATGHLYKTDGTPSGVQLVTSFGSSLNQGSSPVPSLINGKLVVANSTGIWSTDGSDSGTTQIHESLDVHVDQLTTAGKLAFFQHLQMWRTDGTSAGTFPVTTFKVLGGNNPFNAASEPIALGNAVYFCNASASDSGALYRSDGTIAGTLAIRPPKVKKFEVYIQRMTSFRSWVWFTAFADGVGGLYRTDGTSAGTVLVRRFSTSFPDHLTGVGKSLYFFTNETDHHTLWRTDGTEAGTVAIKDLNSVVPALDAGAPEGTATRLFFWVKERETNGDYIRLWTSDGTAKGTIKLSNTLYGDVPNNGTIRRTVADNALYFNAIDPAVGAFAGRIFRSDGTIAGTTPVTPTSLSKFAKLTTVNGTVFFAASDGKRGVEPWRLTTNASLGAIGGNVFLDLDSNGKRTSGEQALPGWRVYLDKNRDGKLNSGEKWQRADIAGRYSFIGLTPGSYQVRSARVAGYSSSTQPNTDDPHFDVNLAVGDAVDRHFGNVKNSSTRNAMHVMRDFTPNPFNTRPLNHDLVADIDL